MLKAACTESSRGSTCASLMMFLTRSSQMKVSSSRCSTTSPVFRKPSSSKSSAVACTHDTNVTLCCNVSLSYADT